MFLTDQSQKNKLMLLVARFFWGSMDWLYPPRCCNCDRQGDVLCAECYSSIDVLNGNFCKQCGYPLQRKQKICDSCQRIPPPFTEMRSWAVFSGTTRKALHSLKYEKNLALGRILAQPLIEIVKRSNWQIDLIVPIPLSRSHLRERGYNQAACISRNVAYKLDIQHSTNTAKRIKETETQISLDVNKRFMNLTDAFYAIPAKLNHKSVLIIDDVITTGATMQNFALALKTAGAERIYCLSVARALLRHPKNT